MYWLNLILLMMAGAYLKRRYQIECDRWMQWDRKENIYEKQAFHFSNRGGVLMEKRFVGFEKYYQNEEALMNWYKKAYPLNFAAAEEEEK
eukprot:CAMPEP_0202958846 /NCGR_PEP_ID=MMETSP1396-20130829/3125_1 /ASSEMBLY_ACC=CAM_ASM_000872 /TAXON_ID= /ORGANISM="Pseudokeronopsis sp., Strain Brazil" /LENGTH=89 /DNA_ID=CAMNT_0049677135 /DNA_START=740 /DNA_END=1009 /DNA_ORIENTATION=-